MADYKLSATLELKDKFTAVVDKAKSGMKSFASTLEGASGSVDKTGSAMGSPLFRQPPKQIRQKGLWKA